MKKGKLYLIPTTLGEDAIQTIPPYVVEIIQEVEEYIAERAKTARRFLKEANINKPLNEITVHELDKHNPTNYLSEFLENALTGTDIGLLSEAGCPGVADPGAEVVALAHKKGIEVRLDLFGEGILKGELLDYIKTNQLNRIVKIHGNQSKEVIKRALNKAHFSILPSKSEGWPKAIAEAMFFGVIPIATKVSCVPKMLDDGKRGILIVPEVNAAVLTIEETLKHKDLKRMSKLASDWSQTFTLEYFESEIKKLLTH